MTRTGWHSRLASGWWWIAPALCLAVASCYSYTGNLHVVPGSRSTPRDRSPADGYTDADLNAAREIARMVAGQFGMTSNDEGVGTVNDMNREFGRRYTVLAYYTRRDKSAPTRAERARINIGVDVRDDRSELIFWIRDLDHGAETDFTRSIKAELERLVRQRFDASYIRYEQFKIATFMSG